MLPDKDAHNPYFGRVHCWWCRSSHAQSLFFFAGYLALGMLLWPNLPGVSDAAADGGASALRGVAAFTIVVFAACLTLLRVRAGLHTLAQVSVGACLGATNGIAMFFTSPTLERRLATLVRENGTAPLIAGLIVVGALLVFSVERMMASRLKKAR